MLSAGLILAAKSTHNHFIAFRAKYQLKFHFLACEGDISYAGAVFPAAGAALAAG